MRDLSQLNAAELLELKSAIFDIFMDRHCDEFEEVVQEVLESMEIDSETSDDNYPYLCYLGNAVTLNTERFIAPAPEFNIDEHLDTLNNIVLEYAQDQLELVGKAVGTYCQNYDLDPDGFKITWEDEAYVVSIAE